VDFAALATGQLQEIDVKKILFATTMLAVGAFAVAPAVNAASIVHDSFGEFTVIAANQGQATNTASNVGLTNVVASRSNLANMFDGDPNTSYALGLGGTGAGGTLELVISPTTNFIQSGSVFELTFAGTQHKEIATLSLGVDGGNYVDIGTLFNIEAVPPGGAVTNAAPAVATLSSFFNGVNTTYFVTVVSGVFNTLKLTDLSPYKLGFGSQGGTRGRDGFDIAELSITSTNGVVPEPATLALFGAGLLGLGLGLARRRRA
jgi:hypothetical protein